MASMAAIVREISASVRRLSAASKKSTKRDNALFNGAWLALKSASSVEKVMAWLTRRQS